MNLYQLLIRPVLFQLPPEAAHQLTVGLCRLAGTLAPMRAIARQCLEFHAPQLQTNVAGLRFDNPIGLAAGWDKSGLAIRMLDSLGFGFAEIGSISASPSLGNPKPRLFRAPLDQAIVVNYGLPNRGAQFVAGRLANRSPRTPLGVNLVKTNRGPGTPPDSVEVIFDDYFQSTSLVHRHASYLTLNLSCPNVAGGGDFFTVPGNIRRVLERLQPLDLACPVFLKVAPSNDPAELERLIAEAEPFRFVRGFMFNLPVGKPASLTLRTPRDHLATMPGAVAGKPVEQLINGCIRELFRRMPRRRFDIIGAGGVFTAEQAYAKIRCGASLVQIYTSLVYEGPGVVRRINQGLCRLLERDGFKNISDAVGGGLQVR